MRKTRSTLPKAQSPHVQHQRFRSDSIKSDPGEISTTKQSGKSIAEIDKPTPKKPGPSLKRCPCLASSGGQAWLLKCTVCDQCWHNTCANLKGTLPKSTIEYLDHWQCPWCFVSPYAPSEKHKSSRLKELLKSTVLSDALVSTIENSIRSVLAEKDTSVTEEVTKASDQNTAFLQSIKSEIDKLEKFTSEMSNIKSSLQTAPQTPIQPTALGPIESTILPDTEENTLVLPECTENFLSDDQARNLLEFCETQSFEREGNREVSFYGQKYQYMGSKKSPKPMPPILEDLVQSLNQNLDYELNQVLINRYSGTNASLPEHSDNEPDINPQSSIFTASLGCEASVTFKHMKSGITSELIVKDKSLYEMSRDLQNQYTHQILPSPNNSLRYSITFRCVHWKYLNSTYFTGDSNFGKLKLGEGRGTIGASTPGFKDFTPTVDKINPNKCASYKNTVIMCGTNDLKLPNANALHTYKIYKGKLEKIRECNPKGNLFVCPVLPSRDRNINSRIVQFNRYLFNDLAKGDLNVQIVQGFGEFVDRDGFLKGSLHDKRTDSDVLHINENGYRILVRQIKSAIFSLKQNKSKSRPGRPYSFVARP